MAPPTCTGLVNAHTHVYSGLAPLGLPRPAGRPQTLLDILQHVWWRLDRALDERALAASAEYYVAEALLHGTTVLIDHHESPNCIEGSLDVIGDACQRLGMRALICYGATERNGGRDEARRGLAECRRFFLTNRRPLVRGAVGLHASFTVSDDTIREAGELCRDLGAVLHVHVAEDAHDVRDARQRGYASPLHRLHALGALVPGSILAHGVHLTVSDVAQADDWRCWIVQNPRSNHGNGVGYPGALSATSRSALGTDGYPADMVEELDAGITVGAAHGDTADQLMARLLGSTQLACECLQLEAPRPPLPATHPRAAIALARRTARSHLVVDGRTILADGHLMTADIERIRERARAEAPRLWNRMTEVTP